MTTADVGSPASGDNDSPRVAPPPNDGLRYDVFLSYSRADLAVAAKMERDLEAFPLPRGVRKLLGHRHLNVFRDISDMTGNQLESGIEQKIEQSRALVVLCSPAARRSKYVPIELRRFAQLRGAGQIVPAMIGGQPNNDPGVAATDMAFPDELGELLGSDPLAVDMRTAWKAKGRKAKITQGSPWVQLVANILGATTDDLTDRIAKAERRRLQALVGILAIVLAIVSALGVVAVIQGNSARTERAEALYQRDQADARFREATSLRLNSEAESMLAGTRSGGSFRAYQQLTAARRLTQTRNDGPLVDALTAATSLVKIVDTGGPVGMVALQPDGTRIASGSDEGDATIRLWDTATGQPIGQPMTSNTYHAVTILAFSPDGSRIVSGCDFEDSVQLWDTATGQSVGSPFTANAAAFNADGTQLVSGSIDHTIRRWDSATGQPIGQPMALPGLSRMAFNPDGTRLLSGVHSSDTIRLLDTATGRSVGQPMKGHADYVASIAFSPDGTRIASGGGEDDTTIRLWDAATGEPIGQPMTGHEDMVSSLAFSPDGTQIVSGSADDTVRLWDAATGEPIGQPITGHTRSVNSRGLQPRRHPHRFRQLGRNRAALGRSHGTAPWPADQRPHGLCTVRGAEPRRHPDRLRQR